MSVHAGTHADAPLHVESSWRASETLPADVFVGEVCVIALPRGADPGAAISIGALRAMIEAVTGIAAAHAERAEGTERTARGFPTRLLCRTGHSVAHGAFPDAWPVLDAEAAQWLVESGLILWGTDAPSVDERTSKSLPVHHTLFRGGAYVLENLALGEVAPGTYELLAQPIALDGADAAPVRALLRALESER